MSASVLDAVVREDGWPAPELKRLQATIAERFRSQGLPMDEEDVATLAEALFGDAVRICLEWMEGG